MAKRKPAARKKPAAKPSTKKKAADPKKEPDGTAYTDDHGITYLGDSVEVWVSCEAKMSREFQSCGIQKGIKFKTPSKDGQTAIERATEIVRQAVKAEVDHMKDVIEAIVDA